MSAVTAAETACLLGELAFSRLNDATDFFSLAGYTGIAVKTRRCLLRIYLDVVVFLNFMVDFLLLSGTNRLAGFPPAGGRTALASALGAVYSGACLWPGFRFLGSFFWRLVCLALMAGIAFGWNRTAVRRCGVFLLLSLAMGGLALSVNQTDIPGLALCGGGIWMLCRLAFGGQTSNRELIPLEIGYGGKRIKLLALPDTGNTLRDPVTAQQVLIISQEAACRLTGLTESQLKNPMQTVMQHPLPGLRLIPYHTIGQPGGLLLAMAFEDVTIGSRKQKAIVAFDTGGLGRGESYQALTGGLL